MPSQRHCIDLTGYGRHKLSDLGIVWEKRLSPDLLSRDHEMKIEMQRPESN